MRTQANGWKSVTVSLIIVSKKGKHYLDWLKVDSWMVF